MREREYAPLVSEPFKDIAELDLFNEFVEPFKYNSFDHRKKLLNSFGHFLEEFKRLHISAEIWIDGSFATLAPDPSDIDVVFYFNPSEINALDAERKELFERLFMTRKFIKNNYKVEVFYGVRGNDLDYQQWQKTYGTCYDNITPKGIFRMYYN